MLVNDNTESRRLMEQCVARGKVTLNPIIDWDDDDVWEYLEEWAKVPHCSLYDEGWRRLGCIGCPMAGSAGMKRDFERFPKYKELYIRAFEKMIENHPGKVKTAEGNLVTEGGAEKCSTVGRDGVPLESRGFTSQDVMEWWLNWHPGIKRFNE